MLLMLGVREMVPSEWPAVERIYAQGIEDGEATFETATPGWEAFDAGKLPRTWRDTLLIERRSAVVEND
ncbi:hypothetical protein [Microbacterium sp.]|jgi:phosphinothricin acetyltransferase|uniref:hypothetical protein n=1 Tax=Microbacterium sp. TaxID=51671 RepID=UPI00262B0AEE|nr:hypothetical protein [Microbacterium sp.]